jgi:hypothetical protein
MLTLRRPDRKTAACHDAGSMYVRLPRDFRHLAVLAMLIWASLAQAAVEPASSKAGCDAERWPRFDRVLLLEQSSETSANVSIGDLTGHGNHDLILAKGRHWPLVSRVLLNDGHGRFEVAHDLAATPYRSYSATLADLTGRGSLDVVLGNDAPDPKVVYLNDGRGDFHLGSTFGRPEWPTRNVTLADLNGDGLPDIIVANRYDNHPGANYVCLNRGGGRFDADCLAFSHESATTIAAADFTGRGHVDLAVPNRDGGQSYVYVNDGQAHFPRRIPFGPPDAHMRVAAAAHLTASGRMDIVAIDERRGTFVYFNRPDGSFSPPLGLGDAGATPYALAVGDLKRDGSTDIVVGYVKAPAVVYFNAGEGHAFMPVPFGDGRGIVYGIAIGDLDGDGWPDIAVARSGAPNVVYFSSGVAPCGR